MSINSDTSRTRFRLADSGFATSCKFVSQLYWFGYAPDSVNIKVTFEKSPRCAQTAQIFIGILIASEPLYDPFSGRPRPKLSEPRALEITFKTACSPLDALKEFSSV